MKKHYFVELLIVIIAFFCLGLKCEKIDDPMSDSASAGYGQYKPPFDLEVFESVETCQEACNRYYTELLRLENERYKQAIIECTTKPCRKAEIRLHNETVKEINEARLQCIRDCHNEGSIGGSF